MSKRLRDAKGRFISKAKQETIEELQQMSGLPDARKIPTQEFYKRFHEIIDINLDGWHRDKIAHSEGWHYDELVKSKSVFIEMEGEDERKTNVSEIRFEMLKFQNYMYTNFNCTGIQWRGWFSFSNERKIVLPDYENMDLEEMTVVERAETLEQYGIRVFESNPRAKKKKERRDERIQRLTVINDNKIKRFRKKGKKKKGK
jgi:hypothetical protein